MDDLAAITGKLHLPGCFEGNPVRLGPLVLCIPGAGTADLIIREQKAMMVLLTACFQGEARPADRDRMGHLNGDEPSSLGALKAGPAGPPRPGR